MYYLFTHSLPESVCNNWWVNIIRFYFKFTIFYPCQLPHLLIPVTTLIKFLSLHFLIFSKYSILFIILINFVSLYILYTFFQYTFFHNLSIVLGIFFQNYMFFETFGNFFKSKKYCFFILYMLYFKYIKQRW